MSPSSPSPSDCDRVTRNSTEVALTGPVPQEMRAAADAAAPKETGGLLLGWWDEHGDVVVRHAIEVEDRWATRTSWTRRESRARRALAVALQELDHPLLGYVGDWHVHPLQCGASGRDHASIVKTSRQYDQAIIMIVRLPDSSMDLIAAQLGFPIQASFHEGDRP